MTVDNQTEDFISASIDNARSELRELAKQIHEHPELGFKEVYAHDYLTNYLEGKGFKVTRSAGRISTAFVATYDTGRPGPSIGICSEFDALQLSERVVCHACGHNLIATVGVATALGIRYAVDQPFYTGGGKIVLFGTPAEEGQGGKNYMLDAGLFKQADVCMMAHPCSGELQFMRSPLIARTSVKVEYFGKPAHAGLNPWAGVNALDAVVLAYNGLSTLRQQIPPNDRLHGIITNGGSAPNVIPDYTSAKFNVRSPKSKGLNDLVKKVENILQSAATATGCEVKTTWDKWPYLDVQNNSGMMKIYSEAMNKAGWSDMHVGSGVPEPATGSTDFGNITHNMPAIHPCFGIHTQHNPHTAGFAEAAGQDIALDDALVTAKALAVTGMKVLENEEIYKSIVQEFKEFQKSQN